MTEVSLPYAKGYTVKLGKRFASVWFEGEHITNVNKSEKERWDILVKLLKENEIDLDAVQ
jgi:hypothetical protein